MKRNYTDIEVCEGMTLLHVSSGEKCVVYKLASFVKSETAYALVHKGEDQLDVVWAKEWKFGYYINYDVLTDEEKFLYEMTGKLP